ncbi:hypothetical protein D1BOALGB6SA_8589 [Olavius sp. associated proteobacterium Delta 1]|nr:hypothetical protein D1BOALGB6SA_8589 [Olavius sp. associated proteobacterium Delta 1]
MHEKYFIISVDTEEDYVFYNNRTHETSVNNLKGILRFQDLCDKFGFIPTYLCTYHVAKSNLSEQFLKPILQNNRCEIGSHFHPWLTPPQQEKKEGLNLVSSDYENDILKMKFDYLHNSIIERFGIIPKAFRAGRWVMNPFQLKLLFKYNYSVDTSVLPFVDYSNISRKKSPQSDYRYVPIKPFYFIEPHIYPHGSKAGILEVPVSSDLFFCGLSMKLFEWAKENIPKFQNIFCWRVFKFGVVSFQWPTFIDNLERLRKMIKRLNSKNFSVLNFAIHSNELSAGYHPSLFEQNRVDLLFQQMEGIFKFLSSAGYLGVGLSEFAIKIFNK